MKTPKVLASVAVLVLAAFWEIVLLEAFEGVGLIAVLVAPFIILLVIGIYGLVDGLGIGSQARIGSAGGKSGIGALGMTVLRMTAQGKSRQEIAAATSVSAAVIEAKAEALERAGFLQDNALTEKGFDAIGESR